MLRLKTTIDTPTIVIKATGISSAVQRYSLEIGLDDHTIAQLGDDWQLLCEAWVGAELALARLGGPTASPALEFKPPQCLVDWSLSRAKKEDITIDFSGISEQMA